LKNSNLAILFDLDGTLIDSTEAILLGFKNAIEKFGEIGYDEKLILSLIGHPLEIMFDRLGVAEQNIKKHIDEYKKNYRAVSKQMTYLLPNAIEAIELASKNAKIGIVTTKTGRYSHELLVHMKIREYFLTLIGREQVINPKPHPEPILTALKELDFEDKSRVFMIGDTCLDIECANSAGVKSVGVLCGYGTKEQLQACGAIIKKDALEAVKFILENDT